MSRAEERARFEHWLAHMDEALDEFLESLADEHRRQLDYSIASLDRLEALLLDRYPDRATARAEGDPRFFDGCSRYIGETLRRNLGGTWDIDLDDRSSVHFGRPTVANFSNHMIPVAPIQWCFTAIHRRKGNMMTGILANFGTR